MTKKLNPLTVGLFGTCGKSTWRNEFIELFEKNRIPFFNPQVENWDPVLAKVEAWHLVNDRFILFPVTDETFAFGSLAESGFCIRHAVEVNEMRVIMIYIAPDVSDSLKEEDPKQAAESRRARTLAIAHLEKVDSPNVFVVHSLEEMREKAVKIFAAMELMESLKGYPTDWRSGMSPEAWLDLTIGSKKAACMASNSEDETSKFASAELT